MKYIDLFSGIGAFGKAMTNLDIDYELVGFSEIDKWAIQSYCAIHDVEEDLNLGDISKIRNEDLPDADLITYGFPCQDISMAGKQKGIKENTRSGLLYEAERIIKYVRPKYAIAENVKNLVGKRHKGDFELLLERLESYGYNNYWKVLNAKDYGVPQNRERVFIVSIRKDVDDGSFEFLSGNDNIIVPVSTIIDSSVFNSDRKVTSTLKPYFNSKYFIKYKSHNGIKKLFDGVAQGYFKSSYSLRRIYSTSGVCPTLTTASMHHFYEIGGRLTPKELFRTVGFDDGDFYSIENVSDTQLIKQAGNSIAVPVAESIFKQLLKEGV